MTYLRTFRCHAGLGGGGWEEVQGSRGGGRTMKKRARSLGLGYLSFAVPPTRRRGYSQPASLYDGALKLQASRSELGRELHRAVSPSTSTSTSGLNLCLSLINVLFSVIQTRTTLPPYRPPYTPLVLDLSACRASTTKDSGAGPEFGWTPSGLAIRLLRWEVGWIRDVKGEDSTGARAGQGETGRMASMRSFSLCSGADDGGTQKRAGLKECLLLQWTTPAGAGEGDEPASISPLSLDVSRTSRIATAAPARLPPMTWRTPFEPWTLDHGAVAAGVAAGQARRARRSGGGGGATCQGTGSPGAAPPAHLLAAGHYPFQSTAPIIIDPTSTSAGAAPNPNTIDRYTSHAGFRVEA
ncbi:hypothetical protein GALMADRAFT_143688 [Galerina marginata CBS 339.88]|uniref:Uncharacterized protein n=1 Tax=Galerina marginata (strain CBS 339.88) TaxID=685588 RepID=A0A067SKD3_GALM3|nr:hypothetical protein GALMADRAFT_143688 [Galerina marginata CBS 339.88]